VLEWHPIGQEDRVSGRDRDELCIAAIAVLAQHLALHAELLAPCPAVAAVAAGQQVVKAYAVAHDRTGNLRPCLLHESCDFVTQCLW
jgi:hypothetical protein